MAKKTVPLPEVTNKAVWALTDIVITATEDAATVIVGGNAVAVSRIDELVEALDQAKVWAKTGQLSE